MNIKTLRNFTDKDINNFKELYKKNDCLIIKEGLTPEFIKLLKENVKFNIDDDCNCIAKLGNTANPERRLYTSGGINKINEYEIEYGYFHDDLNNLLKKIISDKIYKTYGFFTKYISGNMLLPHLDLITNEISVTSCYFCNEVYPIYICKDYIENFYNDRYTVDIEFIKNKEAFKLNLQIGDIAIFNGRNHLHYRKKNDKPNLDYKISLNHFSITKQNDYIHKAYKDVPFENGKMGPLYN